MTKAKRALANVVLMGGSLLALFLVAELIVFRFVLVGSDTIRPDFKDGVVRYAPNQRGEKRVRSEINAPYRINESGWNSTVDRYDTLPPTEGPRIAVIGDSYVNASTVAYDASFAEELGRLLAEHRPEIYRFGMDGAPMSQYLNVLRYVSSKHHPDIVLLVLIHNDFAESYRMARGVYTSSFLKLQIADDGAVEELPPVPYRRRWFDVIRERSATWGYLGARQGVNFGMLRRLILGPENAIPAPQAPDSGGQSSRPGQPQLLPDQVIVPDDSGEAPSSRWQADSIAASYVLGKAAQLASERSFHLMLVMDGDRRSMYGGSPPWRYERNKLVRSLAAEFGIQFLDLHGPFEEEYARTGRRFEFESDNHWNEYAHRFVGSEIARALEAPLDDLVR